MHAAWTSNALAFSQPSWCWTWQATVGMRWSAVSVPTTIRSMSAGPTPASSMARSAAARARSELFSSSATKRRSRMPVRWVIHSSLVSMMRAKSSLLITRSGTYEPVPAMPTRVRVVMAGF